MAGDDNSGARPAGPVVLRIKLRYDDLDAMVQRFASNVGKSGLFLPTKSIQPVGTEVKFELRLSNDAPVLVGLGRVKHVKHPNPANPKAAFGMAIELMRVSREGREVIIRMIERRRALGLADVAIPMPEDVDSARRAEIESQPRADTSNVVREAMSQLASAPSPAAQLLTTQPASGPIGVARESGPITRDSGPIAIARDESKRIPVPVLAPERSRPARPRPQDMIDKAIELSARIVVVPAAELDMHVDVARVLSRARALAGSDLDVELAALRDAAAAPNEISVDAASAELARQLGGKPISKRERSSRWSPPPPVEMKSELPPIVTRYPSEPFATKTRAETEVAPSSTIAAVVDAAVEAQLSAESPAAVEPITAVDAALETLDRPASEPPSLVPEESYVIRQSAELFAQRDAADYDQAFAQQPSTTTAVDPADIDPETLPPKSFGPAHDIKTDPADQRGMMIDDDSDISSFERALDAARIHTGVSKVAPARPNDRDFDDEDPGAELLASGEYQIADEAPNESTIIGVTPIDRFGSHPTMSDQLAAQLDQQLEEAESEAAREVAAALAAERPYGDGAELDDEEISDLDVLAEADEEDEDLMSAHAEADSAQHFAAVEPAPYASEPAVYASGAPRAPEPAYLGAPDPAYPVPEPVDDFASRLDLGDDDEVAPPSDDIDRAAAREFDEDVPQPIHDYSHAPADNSEPPAAYPYQRARRASSENSYTVAEQLPHSTPHFAPHAVGEEFDEPHRFPAPEPPRGPDPRLLKHGRATTQTTEDLEDALAALDANRIDLEGQRRRGPSVSRPLPGVSDVPRSVADRPSRPLPGLPVERPATGPVPVVQSRVAHTVPRNKPPTAQQPAVVPRNTPPTAQQVARPKAPTGSHAKPPPIPAAARRQPTRQVPLVKPPTEQAPVMKMPKRAATDDGVMIDFDEDE
jgi:hypothetical protein